MYLRMFAFLFHYILDDLVWCGEVAWRSMFVSLAVLLVVDIVDGDVVAYFMSYLV